MLDKRKFQMRLDAPSMRPFVDWNQGIEQKETCSDFQIEMEMINRAFAEVMMEGDAEERVFTFPIPT